METMIDTEYKIETGTLLKVLSLIYQQSYGNDMKIDMDGIERSASVYGMDLAPTRNFIFDNELLTQVRKGENPAFTWEGSEPNQQMADEFKLYLSTPKTGKKASERGEAAEGEQPPEAQGESKKGSSNKKRAGWQPEEWILLSENPEAPITALSATLHRSTTAIKGGHNRLAKSEINLSQLIHQVKDEEMKGLRKRLNYYIAKETYSRSSQSYSNLEIDFVRRNILMDNMKMAIKLKRTRNAISVMKTKVRTGNLKGLKIIEEDEEILALLAMRPVEDKEIINTLDALTQEEDDILMHYIMLRDLSPIYYDTLHRKLTRGEFHIDALLSLLRKREAVEWDSKRNNYYKIIRFESTPSRQTDEQPFSALEQDVSKMEKKELSAEEIIPQEEVKSDSSYLELLPRGDGCACQYV